MRQVGHLQELILLVVRNTSEQSESFSEAAITKQEISSST
jgi:hypothetical protein